MKEKFYIQTFEVEGSGKFPLDMLRYDCSRPAREIDSHNIQATGERTVRLVRYALGPTDKPTEQRWQSFHWNVRCVVGGDMTNAANLDDWR